MLEKRRSSSYQLPPIKYTHNNNNNNENNKKNRRRSTSEIHKRRPVDVEVKPIKDEITIFSGICGGLTINSNEIRFILTPEHEALEKRLVKECSNTIANNRGPDINSILSTKPRTRMIVDLEAPTLITHHIVIGSKREASDMSILRSLGITHILNTAAQLDNFFPHLFISHKIPILDAPESNLLDFANETTAFIRRVEEVKGRVFVHCVSGVSRSVSFVLIHLMSTHRIPLKLAYEHIKAARPYIHPNDGFKLQLANYEVSLFGSSSVISHAGKDWEFYEWNRVKHGMKKQKSILQTSSCIIL